MPFGCFRCILLNVNSSVKVIISGMKQLLKVIPWVCIAHPILRITLRLKMADVAIIQSQSWLRKFQINTDAYGLFVFIGEFEPPMKADSNNRAGLFSEVQVTEAWRAPLHTYIYWSSLYRASQPQYIKNYKIRQRNNM